MSSMGALFQLLDLSELSYFHLFLSYAEGFVQALGSYVEKYGDTGLNYFKKAVTKEEVTLEVNELATNVRQIPAKSRI